MDYTVPSKHDALARVFDPSNIQLENGVVQLAVKSNNGKPTCSSFGTKRADLLYGTFRISMKTTPVSGTVSAFFLFGNITSEIDIEALSRLQDPWQTYFTIHPQIYNKDGTASNVTHDEYAGEFNPTVEFHEYRFDWIPGAVKYYVDGQYINTLAQNIPDFPGRVMINHWTDGNPSFSGGPPTEDAILEIANMTLFFNSSEFTSPPICRSTHEPCSVSGKCNEN
ncbi:hypothetical protein DFQ29_008634 [Apophysomyces sp. BC1021]|nr:hypothetical protein DFQ29_008634 [Apophysomyces sp. BC1021]